MTWAIGQSLLDAHNEEEEEEEKKNRERTKRYHRTKSLVFAQHPSLTRRRSRVVGIHCLALASQHPIILNINPLSKVVHFLFTL